MQRRLTAVAAAAIPIVASLATPSGALDKQIEAALKRIEPEARLVQACDFAAIERIEDDRTPFHPEHVMIDQLSPPHKEANTLEGTGGVFRSKGDWYHLTYKCQAADDHLTVLSFSYEIGDRIDRDQWEALGLFP